MLCQREFDMKAVVKELMSQDGARKVQIFRRDDGTFGFDAWRFSDNSLEMCWIPYGQYPECVAPTPEIAEREARGRVEWLRDEKDQS
jgi:hypothetical protein